MSPLRDPLYDREPDRPPSRVPAGVEECERCGALISARSAVKHLNWHDSLAGALRARPPARR